MYTFKLEFSDANNKVYTYKLLPEIAMTFEQAFNSMMRIASNHAQHDFAHYTFCHILTMHNDTIENVDSYEL